MYKIKLKDGTEMVVQSFTVANQALELMSLEKANENVVKADARFLSVEVFEPSKVVK